MIRCACIYFLLLGSIAVTAQQSPSAPSPAPESPADLVERGEKLSRSGQFGPALALYQQALDTNPNMFEAHLGAGEALDMKGDYAAAREHLLKAVEIGSTDLKLNAYHALAVSYTFEGDTFKASEPEMQIMNTRQARQQADGAASTANELGRIYLEANDMDHAYKWYKLGYEKMIHNPDLSEAGKGLWEFRWQSAQARIAARRGKGEEAQAHIVAAKAALDKANDKDQLRFYPYITGYVAFYTGDFKTAVAELQKADQHDPLILVLLGQAYEKLGDTAQAKTYYQKVLEVNAHSLTNAFSRPLAQKKLAGGV